MPYFSCSKYNNLYTQSNQVPISSICRRRRLLWLGHVIREGPVAASYEALQLTLNIDDIKRPRGRPLKRWIDNINDDLKLLNISIKDCFDLAHDKTRWLELIDRCVNPIIWAICELLLLLLLLNIEITAAI